MQQEKVEHWVWFPRWAEVLERESLLPIRRQQFRTAIISYLRYCKQSSQKATVASAHAFMEQTERERPLGLSQREVWKGALRWFFTAAKQQTAPHPSSPAPVGTDRRAVPAVDPSRLAQRSSPTNGTIRDVPALGAVDQGSAEWETQLIRRLRALQYRWRTEQTYGMGMEICPLLGRASRGIRHGGRYPILPECDGE